MNELQERIKELEEENKRLKGMLEFQKATYESQLDNLEKDIYEETTNSIAMEINNIVDIVSSVRDHERMVSMIDRRILALDHKLGGTLKSEMRHYK